MMAGMVIQTKLSASPWSIRPAKATVKNPQGWCIIELPANRTVAPIMIEKPIMRAFLRPIFYR